MKRKILRLSESLINQIAAGEVVENPASIVKELIENSLDANASWISIETAEGGHERIQIADDGCGMSPEDAELSLERHATSKITQIEDLNSLKSMGFRGEALAAIASVSKLELKTSDERSSTKIVAEGGKIKLIEPCARNQGTTIEIRSLFYNVPARKKFQKSIRASQAQVKKTVETIAIAHPEVAFAINGEEFQPKDQKKRIEEILGPYEHEVGSEWVSGFVASPLNAVSTRMGQFLYINRRPIVSLLVAKAVKEAFATRIQAHAYPRFVLFLEIDPGEVDINVHPQKKEARFKDEKKIFEGVKKAVEEAFFRKPIFVEPISFEAPKQTSSSYIREHFPVMPLKVDQVDLDFIYPDRTLGIFGKYLLVQKEHLVLVDIKAAHARVLFESLTFEKGKPQALMVPVELNIQPEEVEAAYRLGEIGVEFRVLRRQLVIDALPSHIEVGEFSLFFDEFKRGKKLEEISTRYIRASQKRYSLEEASAIWRQVQKCADSMYDPLGNLISKEMSPSDLDWYMRRYEGSAT